MNHEGFPQNSSHGRTADKPLAKISSTAHSSSISSFICLDAGGRICFDNVNEKCL